MNLSKMGYSLVLAGGLLASTSTTILAKDKPTDSTDSNVEQKQEDASSPAAQESNKDKAAKKADEKKKNKDKERPERVPLVLQLPPEIELTEEQETKVAEIRQNFADEIRLMRLKMLAAIPDDVLKERARATKEARDAGKSKKEIREITEMYNQKMTAEGLASFMSIRSRSQEIKREFQAKVKPVLTEEQQKLLAGNEDENKDKKKKKKKAEVVTEQE